VSCSLGDQSSRTCRAGRRPCPRVPATAGMPRGGTRRRPRPGGRAPPVALPGGRPMPLSALREKVSLQYAFDRSDYRVAPGGTVAVTVAIQEVFSERSGAALFAPGADGLIGGGVLVRLTGPLPSRPARVKSIADIKGNWHFDFALMPQLP